jgi:hypothetical protein
MPSGTGRTPSRKRQEPSGTPPDGRRNADVLDVLYVLLTLGAFTLLALLVDLLDRRAQR